MKRRNSKTKDKITTKSMPRREQPRKDNGSRRINADNERMDKLPPRVKEYFNRQDSNDISWYTKNPSLFEASTRITWATIQGLTKPFPNSPKPQEIPGTVMAIYYTPNFLNNQQIVQQAWISEYSEIVHANSRNQTYDSTDLAMLTYAGIEIFSAIMMGVRAYGVMRDYTATSYLRPELFLRAMHLDYDDCKKNYSHMWQDIDQLIVQSRQIWIPNNMPIIQRRMWMNSYIYTDADNSHGDYYLYVPATLYKYNPKLTSEGGGLEIERKWNVTAKSVGMGGEPNLEGGLKWQEYVDMVQSMIDALLPDQDRGIIYGDILKCYGVNGIFALNQIDLNYSTLPTYNKEVLWQIENLVCTNAFPIQLRQTADGTFQQLWSNIAGGSGTILPANYPVSEFIMNFHQQEQPTSEQIAIATRMITGGAVEVDKYSSSGPSSWAKGGTMVAPTCSGTEIPVLLGMFNKEYNGTTVVNKVQYLFNLLSLETTMPDASKKKVMDALYTLARMDWAPMLYSGNWRDDSSAFDLSNIYGELDNWSPVNLDTINRIHIALTNSLYNVPTI